MRKQVITDICVPPYANLKLYDVAYMVTVSLPISESIHSYFKSHQTELIKDSEVFCYNGKYYIRWAKTYNYDISFASSFKDAEKYKMILMRDVRLVKSQLLWEEGGALDCKIQEIENRR